MVLVTRSRRGNFRRPHTRDEFCAESRCVGFRNRSLLPRVRFSRVGNRFPVLAEFLCVLLPTFLEGFCVRGSLSVGLFEGPLSVRVWCCSNLTKPEGSRASSRTIGEAPAKNHYAEKHCENLGKGSLALCRKKNTLRSSRLLRQEKKNTLNGLVLVPRYSFSRPFWLAAEFWPL